MMSKRIVWILFLVITLGLAGNGVAAEKQQLTISAAMSLKNAFEEIGTLYETKHKEAKIVFNFGSSGSLARQIEGGAPVDVFASAAQKDMDTLEQKSLIIPSTRVNFAGNEVVMVAPLTSKIQLATLKDLERAEVKRIAIGNPKSVPAGRYAEEVLRHLQLWDKVQKRFVFGEHVRQVLDYAARNEVDAALVYATDAVTRKDEVRIIVHAPEGSHRPIVYPIAAVKGTKNEEAAKEFIALVLSEEGRRILQKYGFKR